jgi:hypothetical protein
VGTERIITRIVGILFLAGFVTYGTGSILTSAELDSLDAGTGLSETSMAFGAVLMILNAIAVLGIGVLLLPIMRRYSEHVAFGYLGARVFESVLLSVGVLFLLLSVPLSQEILASGSPAESGNQILVTLAMEANAYAYQVAMIVLGLGSLPVCYLLYRSGLIPGALAIWGFVGYAVFLTGAVLELFGVGIGVLLSVPGGLFEVAFGLWLIIKGFKTPAVVREPVAMDA